MKGYFLGGYYDDRIFEGDKFAEKTPYTKNVGVYTLEETLKLPFVNSLLEDVEILSDMYKKIYNKDLLAELKNRNIIDEDETDLSLFDFDNLTYEEKKAIILNWTESDEIAGLEYFETREEAEKYKQDILEEIEWCEKNSEFSHYKTVENNIVSKVFVYKKDYSKDN